MLGAGLCRALAGRGLAVRPFRPQNMSSNAAVTADGGEIGRAQALQARAAGVAPSVHMSPVLLKPETETGAQVVLQGRRLTHAGARDYAGLKPQLLAGVLESFARIGGGAELVVRQQNGLHGGAVEREEVVEGLSAARGQPDQAEVAPVDAERNAEASADLEPAEVKVIVIEMGEDDVSDLGDVDAQGSEAPGGLARRETGVDEQVFSLEAVPELQERAVAARTAAQDAEGK